MTLADFLRARFDEDEAGLRAWQDREASGPVMAFNGEQLTVRLLAECETHRQIVELHELTRAAFPGTTVETDPCCMVCSAGGEYPGKGFPCETLRLLAFPYAHHPDCRPEWLP